MKRILFCLQTMILGGVEKQLITIMKQMRPDQYEITLLLLYISDEEIIKQIPDYVRIINLNIDKRYYCSPCAALCLQRLKKGKLLEAAKIALKRGLNIEMSHTSTDISGIPNCDEVYDVAICYHMHSPLMVRYVAEKTKASKKIAWIHSDFSTTHFPVQKLERYLDAYREIIAVSNSVEKEFLQCCPQYRKKVYMHHNILDEAEIAEQAEEPICEAYYLDNTTPRFLTIGRITEQKGFDLAVMAASMLKKNNYAFHWFFIGLGETERIKQLILDYEVEDRIHILGRKNNPYPYLKNCDIYIQPSRHEAYCTAVNEARVLKRPIICFDFAGAREQVKDGETGLVVPSNDVEKLTEAIQYLLDNPQVKAHFTEMQEKETQECYNWNHIQKHFDNIEMDHYTLQG